MKRTLMCILIAALILSILPAGAMAAKSPKIYGPKFMYEGDEVTLGPEIKGIPVELLDWSSADESVVAVRAGQVRAISAGRALISASYGSATAYAGVVVLPREVTVAVGEVISLPYGTKEKYYIEDKTVVAVSKKGQILGLREGTTRVGIAYGSQKMIVRVNVIGSDSAAEQSAAAGLDCAGSTNQIVLVEYQSGSKAKLSIHEKVSGVWKELYSEMAYVGRNGIGKAKEGDGKTPTGTYNLTQPFGIKADPGSNMGYTQVTKYHYWCGTSGSEYYNKLVDMRNVNRKNTSSDEYLINYKGVYNYCMFIDYNASGEAGKGSCIFLHCKGSKSYTGGCIAVSESVMKNIIKWARPGAKIVIR